MRLKDPSQSLPLSRYLQPPGQQSLKLTASSADKKDDPTQLRLQAAGRSFEGFMLGEMLKEMRRSEDAAGGILKPSRAEKMFVEQQCEALGDLLAAREPLGLARLLRSTIGSTGGGTLEDRKQPGQPNQPDQSAPADQSHGSDGAGASVRVSKPFPLPRR